MDDFEKVASLKEWLKNRFFVAPARTLWYHAGLVEETPSALCQKSMLEKIVPAMSPRPKRLAILGATGSIGQSALKVVRDFPEHFDVVALSTNRNTARLSEQVAEFQPQAICLGEKGDASPLSGWKGAIHHGEAGLLELVENYEADLLIVATVGFAGLFPTLAGIRKGCPIALANKEVLVVAGDIVMEEARKNQVPILPIDSEHNAILQCLAGNRREDIRRVILTASGGPFRDATREDLEKVTRAQALDHPNWDMGPKITIDSATLMNKGFEMIEALHLFDLQPEQLDVVVHRQSAIHSMVEYRDGSILAQIGQTDMYLPIQNVLFYPDREPNPFPPLDLAALSRLDFEAPRRDLFPCLDYALEAAARGGAFPAVLNAANEVAVAAFLEEKIAFLHIPRLIRHVMDAHEPVENPDLGTLRELDMRARELAQEELTAV